MGQRGVSLKETEIVRMGRGREWGIGGYQIEKEIERMVGGGGRE